MKRGSSNSRMKRHIISMRISTEELEYLHEIMKGQQFKRVSDLMRAAIKLVLAPPVGDCSTDVPKRMG